MTLFNKSTLFLALACLFTIVTHAQTIADTAIIKGDSVQAKFPGGAQGWVSYLQHHLRADVGAENVKVKKHQTVRQTVVISFLVNKEGKISALR